MAKLVFRKSLWKQCMLEAGNSEQSLEKYTWPDEIDNQEVEYMMIGRCIVVPKWCELIEEDNVERKCKK